MATAGQHTIYNRIERTAMTKIQTAAVVVVLAAAITTVVIQHQSSDKLRAENAALRGQSAELSRLARENARLSNSLAQTDGQQLTHDQLSELLRLRAQAGQLKRDLAAANAAAKARPITATQTQSPPTANEDAGKPFTAEFTARVPTGQSLLTGGWSTTPGMRTFILVTPTAITPSNATAYGAMISSYTKQTDIRSTIFEVPESLLAQLGLDQLTSDGRESSVQGALAAADAKGLMDALKSTEGANILGQPRAIASDGSGAQVSIGAGTGPNGDGPWAGKVVQFVPNLAPDGSGVDLAVKASVTTSEGN